MLTTLINLGIKNAGIVSHEKPQYPLENVQEFDSITDVSTLIYDLGSVTEPVTLRSDRGFITG